MNAQKISGEYHLTGVREMAAAFHFKPDGTFEFYYVYGAVDRMAGGTYTIEENTLRLKSNKEPGRDFNIEKQVKKGSGYTLHILNENPILASNVRCLYFVDGEQYEAYADQQGRIYLDVPSCEKIYVQHNIFPDIATLVKDEANNNNFFQLTLHPDIQQVSFKGIDFTIQGDTLTCFPNYFMPMENIRFVKT